MLKTLFYRIQRAHQTSKTINTKKIISSLIIVELLKTKDKEKIIKGTPKQYVIYRGKIMQRSLISHHNNGDQEMTEQHF